MADGTAIFDYLANLRGCYVKVGSAGVNARTESKASSLAIEALVSAKIPLQDLQPRQSTIEDLENADMVLCATDAKVRQVLSLASDEHVVSTIERYARRCGAQVGSADLADPFGGTLEQNQDCARVLKDQLDYIAVSLAAQQTPKR